MAKKKIVMAGFVLGAALVLGACSDKEEAKEPVTATETENKLIMVSGDTVSEQAGCVLASRFTVGDKIIFRMNALDPETNEQLTDAKLQVHLSTGEVLDMTYGPHAEDNFWVAAYPVTEETPTGNLDYTVKAVDGDRAGEFKPFNVAPSLLTIVADEVVNGEEATEEVAEDTKE